MRVGLFALAQPVGVTGAPSSSAIPPAALPWRVAHPQPWSKEIRVNQIYQPADASTALAACPTSAALPKGPKSTRERLRSVGLGGA